MSDHCAGLGDQIQRMTTIKLLVKITQSTDSDERAADVRVLIETHGSRQLCTEYDAGHLHMPLDHWRALRAVLTVPDYADDDAPQVAIVIEERGDLRACPGS